MREPLEQRFKPRHWFTHGSPVQIKMNISGKKRVYSPVIGDIFFFGRMDLTGPGRNLNQDPVQIF